MESDAIFRQVREQPRIPVAMWVDEVHDGGHYVHHSANLSLGGIYLDHTIPHPPGTRVQLRFTLPGDSEAIFVRGEVVGPSDANQLGMHIRFLGIEENRSLSRRLRTFLNRMTRLHPQLARFALEPA